MSATRLDQPATDDAALARALLAREPRSATLAWVAYSGMVLRFQRRFFGPTCDGQDLCQEVFLRFFRRIDELRDPGAVRGFLMSICLGVARNELRRARVRRWIRLTASGELPEVAGAAGWDPEAREVTAHLYAALERLGAEDRSLFITRHVEKMEIADVAAVHHMSVATTKRRLARLAARLDARMSRDPLLAEYVDRLRQGATKGATVG